MKSNEFNEKWKNYLTEGFYGLDLEHEEAIKYLDNVFCDEIKLNATFRYSQIKIKFGKCRIYATIDLDKKNKWEITVDSIISHLA